MIRYSWLWLDPALLLANSQDSDRAKAIEFKVNWVAQFFEVKHETQAVWYQWFTYKISLNSIEHTQDNNKSDLKMNFLACTYIGFKENIV